MARGRVEGGPSARGAVGAHELVDARRRPAAPAAGDRAAHDLLDERPRRRLDQPQLGAQQRQVARPRRPPLPGQRAREQRELARALGMGEAELERDAAAQAVADEVGRVDPARVEEVDRRRGPCRARRRGRSRGLCESPNPGWSIAIAWYPARGQRDHRREERGLRPAQAVDHHDRLALAGLHVREPGRAAEAQPALGRSAARGRQEADADVQVAAHPELAAAERPQARAGVVARAARHTRSSASIRVSARPSRGGRIRTLSPRIETSRASPFQRTRTRARAVGRVEPLRVEAPDELFRGTAVSPSGG